MSIEHLGEILDGLTPARGSESVVRRGRSDAHSHYGQINGSSSTHHLSDERYGYPVDGTLYERALRKYRKMIS